MPPKDGDTTANSADPDQKEPSYLGLHCLRGPFCPKPEENFSICCFSSFNCNSLHRNFCEESSETVLTLIRAKHSTASDLGLHGLPTSPKWKSRKS